jgi:hypothetical protein
VEACNVPFYRGNPSFIIMENKLRLGKYDIVLHSGNSITEEYCSNAKKVGFIKTDADLVVKIGRNLLIVSDTHKIRKHGGGVQET